MVIETVTYGQIAKVAIIGSGVMGAGIAETMAAGGIDVLLFDQMATRQVRPNSPSRTVCKAALSEASSGPIERHRYWNGLCRYSNWTRSFQLI